MLAAAASIAPLISAGGSVLSGLGGLFGGKGPSPQKQMDMQSDQIAYLSRNQPKWLRQGWEKAGIHPIYGMGGSSASFSPSFSVSGDSVGQSISQMGQGISRAAEALVTQRERLQNRLLEAQIGGQEIENAKRASDLHLTTVAGTPPGLGVSMVPDEQIYGRTDDTGKTAGSHPGFKEWDLGRGRRIELPFSDEGIAESLEGLPWFYTWPKMAEYLYKRYDNYTPGYYMAKKWNEFRQRKK